jgi:hypothetical protein
MTDSSRRAPPLPSLTPTQVAPDDAGAAGSSAAAATPTAMRRITTDGGSAAVESDDPAQLSPVSQLFLGFGDNTPDIYAILRLKGRASVEEIRPKMQQLVDAHARFRMRVTCRKGVWCTEVRMRSHMAARMAAACSCIGVPAPSAHDNSHMQSSSEPPPQHATLRPARMAARRGL